MKAMKPKTVFLYLVVLGCMPSTGYADTLKGAIDESLIVPLATLEAQAEAKKTAYARWRTARDELEAAMEKRDVTSDEYYATKAKASEWFSDVDDTMVKAANEKSLAASEQAMAAIEKHSAALSEWRAASVKTTAKTRQSKKRASHCRATLKPVDDHLELVEIVKCVQIMEAIADACSSTATERFQQYTKQLKVLKYTKKTWKKLQGDIGNSHWNLPETEIDGLEMDNLIDTEMDSLKAYATQCVTENIAGYSALVRYIVMPEAKDQYAGLIEKCRQEETNTLGVLGYQFIWPCFKSYLDMIDEPANREPEEISPEPVEDSETLPKVKA